MLAALIIIIIIITIIISDSSSYLILNEAQLRYHWWWGAKAKKTVYLQSCTKLHRGLGRVGRRWVPVCTGCPPSPSSTRASPDPVAGMRRRETAFLAMTQCPGEGDNWVWNDLLCFLLTNILFSHFLWLLRIPYPQSKEDFLFTIYLGTILECQFIERKVGFISSSIQCTQSNSGQPTKGILKKRRRKSRSKLCQSLACFHPPHPAPQMLWRSK